MDTRYEYNGEYAIKFDSPIYENKDAVELFDCFSGQKVDTSNWDVDHLADVAAEVSASGRHITEKEYNDIVNKKRE